MKCTSDISGKNAQIQNLGEKIEEELDQLKASVVNYQIKLKTMVAGLQTETKFIAQQLEPTVVNVG
jgi:hypothetical protein